MKISFVLISLCIVTNNTNQISKSIKNKPWNIKTVKTHNSFINAVQSFIGSGETQSSKDAFLSFVFGLPYTAVGNKDKLDWGITCLAKSTESTDDDCIIVSDDLNVDFFDFEQYKYKEAEFYIRSIQDQVLDTKDKKKMNVRLIENTQQWTLPNTGVLGLSPKGEFAGYVREMYEDGLSLLFGYTSFTMDKTIYDFNLSIAQNPILAEDQVILRKTIDNESQYWSFEGELQTPNNNLSQKRSQICLSSLGDEAILVDDNVSFCEQLLTTLCKDKKPEECKEDDISKDKGSRITVIIDGKDFPLETSDFISFDKDGLANCVVGSFFGNNSFDECPQQTTLALGKLFYKKYMPLLVFNKDGSAEIAFVNDYHFPVNKGHFVLIVGIIVIILVVGVFLYIFAKRKKEHDDVYEQVSDRRDEEED